MGSTWNCRRSEWCLSSSCSSWWCWRQSWAGALELRKPNQETNIQGRGTNVLSVRSLFTEYPGDRGAVVKAAQDVSFDVPEGKLFTLLGPSGCGKATTLRPIAGLERPTAGEIEVAGKLVYSSAKRVFVAPNKRNFGMVFQSYAIWPHMNVFSNAAFPLEVRHLPTKE